MLLKIEYQYVPVLQTLQEVLNSKHVNLESFKKCASVPSQFESLFNGRYFQENKFLDGDELKISLILYVDELGICNPLGTSKNKT